MMSGAGFPCPRPPLHHCLARPLVVVVQVPTANVGKLGAQLTVEKIGSFFVVYDLSSGAAGSSGWDAAVQQGACHHAPHSKGEWGTMSSSQQRAAAVDDDPDADPALVRSGGRAGGRHQSRGVDTVTSQILATMQTLRNNPAKEIQVSS